MILHLGKDLGPALVEEFDASMFTSVGHSFDYMVTCYLGSCNVLGGLHNTLYFSVPEFFGPYSSQGIGLQLEERNL